MLKVHSDSGSLELTADQERHVRGLDDLSLCQALNTGLDVYVCAVVPERPQIHFVPGLGWRVREARAMAVRERRAPRSVH